VRLLNASRVAVLAGLASALAATLSDAQGGRVFAATARFVAHENMARNMDGRYPQMPGDMVDRISARSSRRSF
jgi:hypothetical protein